MDRQRLQTSLRDLHSDAFGWALACCRRDPDQASEVLQESYCRLLSGRAAFQGRSGFRTFVFGVVRRVALEERQRSFREGARRRPLEAGGQGEPDGISGPAQQAEAKEQAAELLAGLARLSERQREVLHLVFYQGLSLDEAAAVMGVRPGSARRHYERGKRALQSNLNLPTKTTP